MEDEKKEIKLEYALDIYQKGKITLMKAAEVAGISLWKMLDLIRERKIPVNYILEDVEKDLEIARKIILERWSKSR